MSWIIERLRDRHGRTEVGQKPKELSLEEFAEKRLQPLIRRWENLSADLALDEIRLFINRLKEPREVLHPSLTDLILVLSTEKEGELMIRGQKERKKDSPIPEWMWAIPLGDEGNWSEENSLIEVLKSLNVEPRDINSIRLTRGVSANTVKLGELIILKLNLGEEGMEIETFESPPEQPRKIMIEKIFLGRRIFAATFFQEASLMFMRLTDEFWPEVRGDGR